MSDFKVVSVLNPTVVLTAGPAISAGTQSQGTGTINFSNSNGVSFGMNAGVITASVQAGAAAGIGQVNAGTTYASSGTLTFGSSAGNITFGMNNGYITGSAPSGGGAAYVFSNSNNVSFTNNNSTIVASASYPAQTAFVLSDSNGVSFGTNGSTVTASHNGLTTAAQSNHSHGITLNLTNINGTTGGDSNGINLSLSAVVPAQTVQPVAYSAANGSANFSTITFANSNGVSFSTGTQGLYATVKTDYLTTAQPVGNYATSDHTHGNIQFNLTGIGATANSASNGLTLSLSANVAGGGDGYNAAQFTNATANTTQNLLWAGNSNGSGNITIGLTGSTITASAPSGGGGVAINADASSYTSGTVSFGNSNGFSFKTTNGSIVGSYTVPTIPGATVFSNSNNVSFGLNGSTVTATATWPAQTVQPVAYSAANGSANFSTLTFANSNGVSFSTGTQGLYATVRTDYQSAGAYLTTARASNDAIGLNTALTANGVSVTANSSGLSINVPAFLTTAMQSQMTSNYMSTSERDNYFYTSNNTFANNTHTHTVNLYGSGNTTQLSSTAGIDARSLSFEGAGIASVGVSNGRVLVSVPSGGGAGDGVNVVQLGTVGTTGTSWSSISATVQLNGSDGVYVSQNNSNQVVIGMNPRQVSILGNQAGNATVPDGTNGTWYLSGGPNLTISGTGSTIAFSAGAGGAGDVVTRYPINTHCLAQPASISICQTNTTYSARFIPIVLSADYSGNNIAIPFGFNTTTTSDSSAAGTYELLFGLYSHNNSTISLISSSLLSYVWTVSSVSLTLSKPAAVSTTGYVYSSYTASATSQHSSMWGVVNNNRNLVPLVFNNNIYLSKNTPYFLAVLGRYSSTNTRAGATAEFIFGGLQYIRPGTDYFGIVTNALISKISSTQLLSYDFIYRATSTGEYGGRSLLDSIHITRLVDNETCPGMLFFSST